MDKKQIRYHHCHILEKHKWLSFKSFTDVCFHKLVYKFISNLALEPLSLFLES